VAVTVAPSWRRPSEPVPNPDAEGADPDAPVAEPAVPVKPVPGTVADVAEVALAEVVRIDVA
jgi:hypothetical protein